MKVLEFLTNIVYVGKLQTIYTTKILLL